MSKEIKERLAALRNEMEAAGLAWFADTGSDAHQGEYVASHWRTRCFLSGFTGSAGTVLVGRDRALLWADSRYFIQAAAELEGSGIELMKMDMPGVPTVEEYLKKNSSKGEKIGRCARTISIKDFKSEGEKYAAFGLELVASDDLVDRIWTDRPEMPATHVHEIPTAIAGLSRREKLGQIRTKLAEKGADCTFIATIDDIAWITNLRADDIPCNPVFLSFMFIDMEKAVLFTDEKRFDASLKKEVEKDLEIRPYMAAYSDLKGLVHGTVYYSDEKVNMDFLPSLGEKTITGRDISTDLKAAKNPTELEGMRKSHLMDGVAFINAFAQVDFTKTDGTYNEIAISRIFEEAREKLDGYAGPSFNPISGFGEHGAMCHYSASEESNAKIDHDGLLVLDTGSQFDYGMTDLTRTLLFGDATGEQKRDYTLTLKGHLALSRAVFIQGTRGYQLDVLAKQFMWKEGISFYHGTGHGVGFHLNVHEGPMRISALPIDVALECGMVISDEPGIYKEGRHGIRIENLIAVKKEMETEFGQFLSFEVLTLVPYERRLIDTSILTVEEMDQIDAYHKRVYESLKDLVDADARGYLEQCTRPLDRC